MPTTDDETFCTFCSDSYEVEAGYQPQHEPTAYVSCQMCPRCTICTMRVAEGCAPGLVDRDWACSPGCAVEIWTGNIPLQDASAQVRADALEDAAQSLRIRIAAGEQSNPRDVLLNARVCNVISASLVLASHSFPQHPVGTLNEVLKDIAAPGAKS